MKQQDLSHILVAVKEEKSKKIAHLTFQVSQKRASLFYKLVKSYLMLFYSQDKKVTIVDDFLSQQDHTAVKDTLIPETEFLLLEGSNLGKQFARICNQIWLN